MSSKDVLKLLVAGKPVVASMGTYAASGGYYIATAADKITALVVLYFALTC